MRAAGAGLSSFVLLSACAGGAPSPETEPPAPGSTRGEAADEPSPVTAEGPFVYVAPTHRHEPAPSRFTEALPPMLAEWKSWGAVYPPRPVVHEELCYGDEARWTALLDAAGKAVVMEDPEAEVVAAYGGILAYCGPAVCTRARAAWGAGGLGAKVAAHALVGCPDVREVFTSPEVPPDALVRYWSDHADPPPEVRARAAAVVAGFARAGDNLGTGDAARLAGGLDDPAVAKQLLAAAEAANGTFTRNLVLRALGRQSAPEARAAFKAFCASSPDDYFCTGGTDSAAPVGAPPPPPEGWASFAALDTKLTEIGLVHGPAPAGDHPGSVVGTLEGYGVADSFDTETDSYPNEHHALLTRLAHLGGDALAGVRFDEVAPPDTGAGSPDIVTDDRGNVLSTAGGAHSGVYTLEAWMDGDLYTVVAENLGDWYDLERVVGLLNTLARTRGRPERWVTLVTGDQTATVLAAPEGAIRAAVAENLVQVGAAGAASADGKASEARAVEAIRAGGGR